MNVLSGGTAFKKLGSSIVLKKLRLEKAAKRAAKRAAKIVKILTYQGAAKLVDFSLS